MPKVDFCIAPISDRRWHYVDHMAPVYHALPEESRGEFHALRPLAEYARDRYGIPATAYPDRWTMVKALIGHLVKPLTVVCGHADPGWLDNTSRPNVIMMHGVGFTPPAGSVHPSYPGTKSHRTKTRLMLATNERIAEIERGALPHIPIVSVGCPKLDKWHGITRSRKPGEKPTIALAWHWDCRVAPEMRTAFYEYAAALSELMEQYTVLGHGHPLIIEELRPHYDKLGIEVVSDLEEVFERADLMAADGTSAIYEFAALGRPVVSLNGAGTTGKGLGGMWTERELLGPVCHGKENLLPTIARALEDSAPLPENRKRASETCYGQLDGKASERAAAAILGTLAGIVAPSAPRRIIHVPTPTTVRLRPQAPSSREAEREYWLAGMGWKLPRSAMNPPDPPNGWPAVGIVIPAYNAPHLLERCLDGLAATDYPGINLRVVVVDNASRNARTLEILKKPGLGAEVVRFAAGVGFSEAVNAGIRKLEGCAYHILYNQDVAVVDTQWLKHLIRWMEHRPTCAIAGPKLLYEDGTIENAGIDMGSNDGCAERGRGQHADDPRFNDYRKVATVSGACYCIRTSIYPEMGLMDERYLFGCEDLEYGMRVSAQLGIECWYVPDAVLIHSSHAVQRAERLDRARVKAMHAVSAGIYNREWGTYFNHLGTGTRIAFVLPNFHSACGGARVVGALARQLSICGVPATVYVRKQESDPDGDFPKFPIRPLSELREAEIVIATRCDTLADALKVQAAERYYFVQQIEDCMSENFGCPKAAALASYQDTRFKIITIGEHLAARLKEMGRESTVVDVGFYRAEYTLVKRSLWHTAQRVLMYGAEGYKGPRQAAIAEAIRRAVPGVLVNSFHRFAKTPAWADTHYRPQTTAEVAALYADHDVYVYASESDGFAMTPVESMATGTPVVIWDFPGHAQYSRDRENCLIAPFGDVDGVAERARELLCSKKLWAQLAVSGPATADRYDWNRVGAQYAKLLLGAPV